MDLIQLLKENSDLSGWAQFAGSMIALLLTYWLATHPVRYRKRRLEASAKRLLQNGYETLESFHRTSGFIDVGALNIRAACLTMENVANEIDRFPIFELEDQGSRSLARHLVAVAGQLKLINLILEDRAATLGSNLMTNREKDELRLLLGNQAKLVADIIAGKPLQRPEGPVEFTSV